MKAEEIKFKAQREDGKGWVYGDLIHGVNHKSGKTYILPVVGGVLPLSGCDPIDGYEVYPETICQFTGLKDKNGVEIYEGDIIRYYQPHSKTFHTHIVRWDDLFACFGLFKQDSKWCVESDWLKIEEIEVVGNIHDKNKQKRALIDTMRGDEEIGLYDDNPKNH